MTDMPVTETRNLIQRIKNEGMFPGIESLIPMMYPQLDTFFNYIPDQTLFVMIEPDQIHEAAEDYKERMERNYLSACEDGRLCVEPSSLCLEWDTAKILLEDRKPLSIKYFNIPASGRSKGDSGIHHDVSIEDNSAVRSELKQQHHQMNVFSPVINWISKNRDQGNRIITVCRTKLQADRFVALVKPYGVRTRIARGFHADAPDQETLTVCLGRISTGFVWGEESLAVITEDEIFGRKLRQKRSARKHVRTDLLSLDELKKEDLVVHLEHGIGQYQGLVKLDLDGVTNDYLLILYKGDDKLYLPIDRMNVIQKYIGVDGLAPILDKMGGKAWDKVKKRVKRSAEKIAGELLNLYADRKVRTGIAFGKPDSYFHDFEAAFPYEETEDQIKAIDDVLSDMETPSPMDRLICGDVGYGKTEVALRASFVTIYNGKQAALLVPTTVLAEQHLRTFTDRFKDYPVIVACLSRFRSPRVQREIVNDLKAGKIDIIIGTHRILQKDVAFKELGLLIIDEEQRFGVRHKERIKQLRSMVDVLTLTATPIPRTLHLSLLGIRDISVISTPPEHRHPILTYVAEFDDAVIAEAIRKELERKGQIFFVHNNIHTIYAMATHLQKLVPEVRLDVAHGRMKDTELERVMIRFFQQESDMLVCTTIIESGLDIPSANTILVNRADRFGLAQIYQLRGRVGRADEQAYAYLFIPRNSALGIDAQKRLRVLMEHSDLGSGFQIAMSDLKIRGGGTILGSDQSGHIAAVGYDMFLQLMEEAVTRMKGEPLAEPLEPEIHIPLSAFIPESYIPDIDQRLATYRRLARMSDNKEISSLKVELADRFGPLPVETKNLLLKIMLRVLSKKCGARRLDMADGHLRLELSASHQINPNGVVELIQSDPNRYALTPDHVLMASLFRKRTNGQLKEAKNILKEIAQRVNA
ncbi:MAG TPA: transcription-repair coupling factor [Deltaproteobacteria bacterium]|nr:transcription-repair coupling factor [Deltaproteobacteria bacterium]